MEAEMIKVFDITKNFAIDSDVGEVVHNKVSDAMKENEKVVLDFENVDIILSVFLNSVISGFYNNNKGIEFENKVQILNLSPSAKILWDRVVASVKRKSKTN